MLNPPASDEALVALGRVLARTLDRMSQAERRAMAGQTSPQLLKVLVELEGRAQRRPGEQKKAPSRLDKLREARATGRPPVW